MLLLFQLVGGLVLAMAVHEAGHALAAWRRGLVLQEVRLGIGRAWAGVRVGAVVVSLGRVPIAVSIRFQGTDLTAGDRASIAAGGPVATAVLGALVFLAAYLGHSPHPWYFLSAVIGLGAWGELLPVFPLDGYRVVAACREASGR
ncbi:MAG: hypothetical protein M0031_02895 [Thermaerobacter sp.]|nr:hypothetical protein [Thermaerobacter sp.]